MRVIAIVLLAHCFGAASVLAQSPDSIVARAIRAEMQRTHAPGAAIAIVRDGRLAHAAGFGVTSAEGGQSVTPATLFRIGSVTKALTGIAALQMREKGLLTFSAPIGRIVPDLHPGLASLTLHQLLSHTAGMGNAGSANGSHDDDALAERVRNWGAEQIIGPPDDLYSYSSTGYWLAAYVMEKAGGAHYADLMTAHVFTPLGMTRSTLRPLMALTYPLALDHRVGPDGVARVLRPYADDASTWAGGSVFSSVEELARVAIALMDSGRIDGTQVLPPDVVRDMLTAHADQPLGSCAYTYGLSRCNRGGVVTFSHYGFRSGSGAVFTLVPERRAAVIILSNRNGGIFGATEQAVLEQLLGPETTEAANGQEQSPPAGNPADFVGSYVSVRDTLHIARKGNGLVLRYGSTEQPARATDERTLAVLNAEGDPVQQFHLVRGKSGALYLHDGISAFRRIAR